MRKQLWIPEKKFNQGSKRPLQQKYETLMKETEDTKTSRVHGLEN
jgi:hypothetical protein